MKESSKYNNIEETSIENFGHRPRKLRGWKAHQLLKGEDYVSFESDLGSDNCWRLIVICCGYKRGE
jgi:hypothetical protein